MTCNANHPIYSTNLCELPDNHAGSHSTLVRGGKFSTCHTWLQTTVEVVPSKNIAGVESPAADWPTLFSMPAFRKFCEATVREDEAERRSERED